MQYEHKVTGQALVVTIGGEFDLHTAPALREFVDKQLTDYPDVKHLIFNVEGVTFIDSSGLGVILGRYRMILQRHGKLVFVKARPQVQRVLELSGFQKIAEFAASSREALDKL